MFVGVVPYAAPSNVQARLLENSTIILTWEPPPTELQNGELIGYMVSAEMVLLVWRTAVVYFMEGRHQSSQAIKLFQASEN